MKTKLLTYLLMFLFLFSFIPVDPVSSDKQIWENQYGKLEVEPTTSNNLIRQKQFFNATWYYPNAYLDIAFCFNSSLSYGQVFYWNGNSYVKINPNHVLYNGKHYYVLSNIFFNHDETKHGYWEYDVPPKSNGKWDLYLKLNSDSWSYAFENNRYVHLDPWWNSEWDYKKQITLDYTQVPVDLPFFPVIINISSDSDLSSKAQSDGGDIAFTNGAETTQLGHELITFDSATGQMIAWVNTTLDADADTTIYMYYGNSECGNQSNRVNTWDSDYMGIYHFNNLNDSSNTPKGLTDYGGNKVSSGIINNCWDFENDNTDYLSSDSFHDFTSETAFTIETWFNVETIDADDSKNVGIHLCDTISNDRGIQLRYGPTTSQYFVLVLKNTSDVSTTLSSSAFNTHQWYHVVGTGDETGIALYIDGSEYDSNSDVVGFSFPTDDLYLGYCRNINKYFDGRMDEVRISTIKRNTSWITTTYNTMSNATDGSFFTVGTEYGLVAPDPPTDFYANTSSNGNINISWTMGTNATHTLVERNTISTWSMGSGTQLYNGSRTFVIDLSSNLSCNALYYYQGWSYNSTSNNFSTSNTSYNLSCPGNPSGVDAVAYPSALNFTWTNNTYATSTLLIRKTGSYPTSVTDGTVLQNNTLKYYNDTGVDYDTHYYSIFSYNSTINRYSSGYNIPIGFLQVSVYNENTSIAINNWGIHVSDQTGGQVYEQLNCSNPTTIDNSELPIGLCTILINHTDYESRIYYMTIVSNQPHYLNCYLAEKGSLTNYYVIQVVDEFTVGIQDVLVTISEYDNTSGVFSEISSQYTDGNGEIGLYLIGGKHYKVNLTKNLYEDIVGTDYFPDPVYFGKYYPKIFKMFSEGIDEFDNETMYHECITFDGYVSGTTLYVNYSDSCTETVDTSIKVYEINTSTGTMTAFSWDNRTSSNSFQASFTGINTSNCYKVVLYLNHTYFGSYTVFFLWCEITTLTTKSVFDTLFNLNYGTSPGGFGWSNILAFIILVSGMFAFGQDGSGIAMIVTGGLMFFVNSYIGLTVISILACSLLIVFGILVVWSNLRRKGGG